MQHHIQTLVKHFFHKETLQEVTVNQLQQFIDDYPYSAIGQFLLAKKLRDTGAQNFDEQGGKATLYFNDPVWAGWVLREDTGGNTHFEDFHREPEPENETPHFVFNTTPESTEPAPASEETPPWEEPTLAPEPVIEQVHAPGQSEPIQHETSATSEPASTEAHPASTVSSEVDKPAAQPAAETLSGSSLVSGASTASPNDDLSFEPYHTIDYFASLGIKLKPEELAKDKLGQQLKSFTDWLRSMKRITPAQGAEKVPELDELTSQSIQKIAEYSNDAKEIITEAMAEVWAKQGHKEKAVAIYEKLSLLNPSKSHYFAARIEALKS
jgi:hypothetical protein